MHAMRFVLVVLGAGLVTSMTDWLCAGDWIHRRWTYPEAWRQGGEGRAVALTSPLPFVTCGLFAAVAMWLGAVTVGRAATLALALWAMGPLAVILTNAAFLKLHRVFVGMYALGWLVKLMVAAVAVGVFLRG